MVNLNLGVLVIFTVLCSLSCTESLNNSELLNATEKINVELNNTHGGHKRHHLFFVPFAKPFPKTVGDSNSSDECELKGDEDDFPYFLSEDQVLHGGIVLVVFIGIYGFSLLAVVCNNYFLPCVETICERLNVTPDVAAATFMSIATSTPEFFTNVIGTFITESDLGIGTIVGSSLCNALLVPAVGGLNSPFPLQLDWYPLTRDCIIYAISVTVLIIITWDGIIYYYETFIPLSIYITYFIIMFNNKKIAKFIKNKVRGNKVDITPRSSKKANVNNNNIINNNIEDVKKPSILDERKLSQLDVKKLSVISDAPKQSILSAYGTYMKGPENPDYELEHQKVMEAIQLEEQKEAKKSLFRRPEGSWLKKCLFYYTWPIKLILKYTIPSPKTHPKWFVVTFLMCIVYIGVNSYIVSWMISIIGTVTKLPDVLLGMTLMAVGGCLPETVSMTIIARRGEGSFGVSNSLGANTMNVLYSLGLPWLFKSILNGLSTDHPVKIQSGSIEYTIMSLIFAVAALYFVLLIGKFRLSKISGSVLGVIYIGLVSVAIVSQTVLFKPKC